MPQPNPAAPDDGGDPSTLTREQRDVLHAFALGWTIRPRSWVHRLLGELGARDSRDKRYTGELVHEAVKALAAGHWLTEDRVRPGYWQVASSRRSAAYLRTIDEQDAAKLRGALVRALDIDESGAYLYGRFRDLDAAAALVRLELFSGRPFAAVSRLKALCGYATPWESVLHAALERDLDEPLFRRLEPSLQQQIVFRALATQNRQWNVDPLPLVVWCETFLAANAEASTFPLRMEFAQHLLWAGRDADIDAVMQPLRHGRATDAFWQAHADAAAAAVRALHGDWAAAETEYAVAYATLKVEAHRRTGLLPDMLALPYVLALLAQQTPAHLERAYKFCLAESGKRQTTMDSSWGLIATALQMRRGDAPLEPARFRPLSDEHHLFPLDLWRWWMRAWLKADAAPELLPARELAAAHGLGERLRSIGLQRLAGQLDAAVARLQCQPTPAAFFVPPAQEGWRMALAALAAIGGGAPVAAKADAAAGATRLVWVLSVDKTGGLTDIVPLEQKHGARGWSKPREVPLSRLSRTEVLPPHDAAVARCLKKLSYGNAWRLDLAAGLSALLGHPAVEFADAPGIAVTLTEGQPEIEVVDDGEQLQLRLRPRLRGDGRSNEAETWHLDAGERKEAEALRLLSIVRDSASRARVLRFTPAQRRAALLIGEQLTLPKAARGPLQDVLQGLGAHFQVHADELNLADGARDVPADATLRAELAPVGDGVSLRLVTAPFGPKGPRVAPGYGRARMISAVGGETLAVQRDLAQERAHLDSVLDACPMLDALPASGQAEWAVEAPDDALALVERLPTLAAVGALDWPQGKALRVDSAGLSQLKVQLRSGRDWLGLQGGIEVDEGLVAGLEQLMQWSAAGKGRFVPMGQGRYLALTQELRARLADLASVAELHKDGVRVAPVNAPWLDAALDGAALEADKAFRQRVERLLQAQQLQPALPATLQATLRPYQEEGYAWAMRLAHAGFGACLADDMGLGKTLQALAVMLERAAGGPALVVAPTSLGGNWSAEARRFAPTLNVRVFGEGDRDAAIASAGPGDAIIVSYQLLQLNARAFAERRWHTLVLDEAQAIKNAAAKRSLAAYELAADFRIALSGTPIENRLSELWSIMRVCNPGLLASLPRFNERFAVPIERDRDRNAQRTLRRLIGPFILRRTKAQVLDDLPPRTELTLAVEPEAAERAHYEALRRQALAAAEASLASDAPGQAQFNVLAQLTRLRRAACDPRLVSPELGLVGAKVQAFGELAAELVANGHKALVFSQFVDFLTLLREPLDAAGIAYQYLDGSTPAAERSKRVAAFQAGQGELFLISLKAGGFGLNLTAADYVVIADPWWNPAAEDQASGRAHRIGQQRPVTVYRLVHSGTLEERIVALHQQKRELADSVLEGGEGASALKAQELVDLMREGAA